MAVLIVQAELRDFELRNQHAELPAAEAEQFFFLVAFRVAALDFNGIGNEIAEVFALVVMADPNDEILLGAVGDLRRPVEPEIIGSS